MIDWLDYLRVLSQSSGFLNMHFYPPAIFRIRRST